MENKIIHFKEGILGFEELKEFILLEEEGSKFYYLQAVAQEEICFVVINPYDFMEAYTPQISEYYFEQLGGGATEDFVAYAIVRVAKQVEEIVVNLQAPILINIESKLGIQVIVDGNQYSRQTKLIELTKRGVK